jgi:hypothetical protein
MLKEELDRMNEKPLKKTIKSRKPIVKSNKVQNTVDDNKRKDVEEMYVRWFKEKKVISNNDEIAIEMVQCSNVAWQQYIESLAVEFKMIASEGLRKPEDILAITKQILTGKGL